MTERILFLGAFEDLNVNSTNIWQRDAIADMDYHVDGFSYKAHDDMTGATLKKIDKYKPDLTVIAKGSHLERDIVEAANEHGKTVLWMPDFTHNWDELMEEMITDCNASYMSRHSTTAMAKVLNPRSYFLPEGYNPREHYTQKPKQKIAKTVSVSHIGSLHGTNCHFGRQEMLQCVGGENFMAFGDDHRHTVWKSKINLNFTEGDGTSDRLFKLMAAGGFVLCQYFRGLEEMFRIGRDLDVFSCPRELQLKVQHYLDNPMEMHNMRVWAATSVRAYTNANWAYRITEVLRENK